MAPLRKLARAACLAFAVAAHAATMAPPALAASRPAQRSKHAMVAGPEPLAVHEGLAILREGGNAVDAAVTMGFVLAVTMPQAGNIAGGGYMLIHAEGSSPLFIDYRETAPAAASRDMFLDDAGKPIADASLRTYRAVGVPGTVAGLALALERAGTIPLKRAVAPAIRLAREGFAVGRGLEASLAAGRESLSRYPASREIFFKDGVPLREGDRLVQRDLAETLQAVAREGPGAFYRGRIARALEADMAANGGLITAADLASYRPVTRDALSGAYRSYRVLSAPPSSSGGVGLLQMLNMLEPYDLRAMGHNSSAYVHHLAEAMKRAFADRARWLGDPDFVRLPLTGLLSRPYADRLMSSFDPDRSTPAEQAGPGDPLAFENASTTHFSVVDPRGGVVANTYTLNDSFGCGAVARGLGFLLNNEMDDFAATPNAPNMYGLVGGEANSIAPGKRMLSSMTPTIVLRVDSAGGSHPYLALGSPGGPAIITAVLQTTLNVIEFGMDLQAAVDAPRVHHQWAPDRLWLEAGGFPADVMLALRSRGHDIVERGARGDVQAVLLEPDGIWLRGASDARGYGLAAGY